MTKHTAPRFSENNMRYRLRPVHSPADWRHLHGIRRAVLFNPERHSVAYDDNHPADRAPGNQPFLLLYDHRPIGVARLDIRGDTAILRLVAINEEEQGRGHGRKLNALIEAAARRQKVTELRVNAAPDAVGYYEEMGWRRASWDTRELVGFARDCVQMTKL